MRIVFMGTPAFAVETFRRIVADGHEIGGVFTQPDKPQGRKMRLTPPPVKLAAEEIGAPVFQPATLKDPAVQRTIFNLAPQVIVVVAYGQILPEKVLNIPKLGCINLHASLLPHYRGAAPIQWAVINGERETGVTTMHMAKGLDTGDMILKRTVPIGEDETYGELHDKLMRVGARLVSETLPLLESGNAPREKQDDALATYAPRITHETGLLDFAKSAAAAHNLVRGLSPAPGAYTNFRGKGLKVWSTRLSGVRNGVPGTVFPDGETLEVLCGDGCCVRLLEVQEQGGKRMDVALYLRGHHPLPGERMGV
ncbi:methionyl-tRNA formyltransferase [Ethanoligenens harbinense]|uniref:Methionyl-tRNA formyltransferase n=1 Tax=Ethanoligenens harbinense (strain DSM 18485 / JCM 12961 / CGMCC 1.5033 / YUAN-3) TaxID=663278 RepID=E6U3N1_ETHHY|nr:methionyl-tRNA formyltransferase [Ethanoligenens harbinense]ADU27631.1 methionyl-tRNA formyltransferase [Ethanoligenens harbinense YUAN-3]AVQ96667.1 methionyl-tRNA formyltransferase [Ethanoligenens harbinense YUAN-3]AYF39327.1 methionyl-tRNA formyltransferase [Ethanoligenens harbinense]AYF42152.1 methionyl-tRNA formyltransferase [Ethanoligenens harbinense]QCN92907.1 methionyl-tRNA formyltransferase [Ethanoligenens harbinense]